MVALSDSDSDSVITLHVQPTTTEKNTNRRGNKMAVEHAAGSYHDRYLVDEPAFLTSVLLCVHPEAQQGVHPEPSRVQGRDPVSAPSCPDPFSSCPSTSPKPGPGSDCASCGPFWYASPGQKYQPHPGGECLRPPASHG